MADLDKHLERAEKYAVKGKLGAAIQEYKAAYDIVPHNLNLLRTIADLCVREGRREEAVRYYGDLFDNYAAKNDATKGIPLFRKSLQGAPQPAERYASLARLLQRAKKPASCNAPRRTTKPWRPTARRSNSTASQATPRGCSSVWSASLTSTPRTRRFRSSSPSTPTP
jgi:tetratricopeptide (TPR) repeat protein